MVKLCDIDPAAKEKLPPGTPDKSGVGVHYMDAFIKPINTKLEDGTRVSCRRKGLKLSLRVGSNKGSGLMRRLDVSPDPVVMIKAALEEAAKEAGIEIKVTDTETGKSINNIILYLYRKQSYCHKKKLSSYNGIYDIRCWDDPQVILYIGSEGYCASRYYPMEELKKKLEQIKSRTRWWESIDPVNSAPKVLTEREDSPAE